MCSALTLVILFPDGHPGFQVTGMIEGFGGGGVG